VMHTHICTHTHTAHLATLHTYLDTCTETMQSGTLIPHTHTYDAMHTLFLFSWKYQMSSVCQTA